MKRRAALFLFVLLVFYILNAFANPIPKKDSVYGFRPKYGVTYSFEQASWYGLDPRTAYIRLLEGAKYDWVRLPFFWDHPSASSGQIGNLDDLEFGIQEAAKRDIKVIVAIGAKTPYYPEYHLPKYISEQVAFGDRIDTSHQVADDVLVINRKVVTKLSKYENISHWQVENEPFLANINNVKIDKDLIAKEVDVVRRNDIRGRPVILSHVGPAVFDSEWKDLVLLLKEGDVLGVNAYFKTQGVNLFSVSLLGRIVTVPWPEKLVWPVQSWYGFSPNYEAIKKDLQRRGIELWVLEMQAEPYIRTREYADGDTFFLAPDDVSKADEFLKSSRIESVGFWGAPFWLYRESIGDKSWVDTVSGIVD